MIAHGTSEELIRAIEEEKNKLASLKCRKILKELGVKYRTDAGFFTDAYDLFVIGVILAVLSSYAVPASRSCGPHAA